VSLWRAFLPCYSVGPNDFFYFRQGTYIVFILQCQKAQNNYQIVYRYIIVLAISLIDFYLLVHNIWKQNYIHISFTCICIYILFAILNKYVIDSFNICLKSEYKAL
jgi:hypothetical protein